MKKTLNSNQVATIWNCNAEQFTKHYTSLGDCDREMIINPVIFELLNDIEGKVILDAGCGEGYLSRILASKCKKVIAVDFSEKMLSIAKAKTEQANIEYNHASIESLGFLESNSIDIVVSVTVFQDVPDYIAAIKEIHRVLKPSGVFVLVTTHPCFSAPVHGWHKDEYGYKSFWKVDNYFSEGLYDSQWADDDGNKRLVYFHRTLETYYDALTKCGFYIKSIKEPRPNKTGVLRYPWLMNDMRVAHYLIMQCTKGE